MKLPGKIVVALAAAWMACFPAQASEQDDVKALLEEAYAPWQGDLDSMVERGFIRVLTVRNPVYFSIDGFDQRGLLHDLMRRYEKSLLKQLGKRAENLRIVIIPAPRDQLIPRLLEGRGDMIIANLTVTESRKKQVAFSLPIFDGVKEIIVTGPAGADIADFDDLAEKGLMLRKTSSYDDHVFRLNAARKEAGKKTIPVKPAPEILEDYDLLEMVSAGLLPAVIVDDHTAKLWAKLLTKLKLHEDMATNEGGNVAWAMRKANPELLAVTNNFLKDFHPQSRSAKQLRKQYVEDPRWLKNSLSKNDLARYKQVVEIIKKYAVMYKFDYLMIAAQGYQESGLNQDARSHVGAIGIMQLMPTTARDRAVNIPNIEDADANVHAGVKYLRHLRRHYYDKPDLTPLNQNLFAFAAYNAGPGNVNKARKRAQKMGLNPNIWFGHVEIAMARAVSREPVIYVRHIFKYYVGYKTQAQIDAASDKQKSQSSKSD